GNRDQVKTPGRSRGSCCGTAPGCKNFQDSLRCNTPSTNVEQGAYYISHHVPQKPVSLDGVDQLFSLPGYYGGKDCANSGFLFGLDSRLNLGLNWEFLLGFLLWCFLPQFMVLVG